MAVTKRPRGRWASRFHFLVRFLGLTGLVAAAVGGVLAGLRHMLPSWNDDRSAWDNARALGLAPGSEVAVSVLVRDLFTGRSLPPEEFRTLPGFVPACVWSGVPKAARPAPTVAGGGGCAAGAQASPVCA